MKGLVVWPLLYAWTRGVQAAGKHIWYSDFRTGCDMVARENVQ